jgi:hypothetical protein
LPAGNGLFNAPDQVIGHKKAPVPLKVPALFREERAEDHGHRPRHLDVRLAKFAAAAGKADKG